MKYEKKIVFKMNITSSYFIDKIVDRNIRDIFTILGSIIQYMGKNDMHKTGVILLEVFDHHYEILLTKGGQVNEKSRNSQ